MVRCMIAVATLNMHTGMQMYSMCDDDVMGSKILHVSLTFRVYGVRIAPARAAVSNQTSLANEPC